MWSIQEVTDSRTLVSETFDSIEQFISMTNEGSAIVREIDADLFLIAADGTEFFAWRVKN